MDVYIRLLSIYQKQGFNISGGLYPWHFDRLYPMESIRTYRSFPFITLTRNKEVMSMGGGINPLEILIFVAIVRALKPKRIFIIGNAFGWSTFALGLACEDVQVFVIDSVEEGEDAQKGFHLTEKIIKEEEISNITLLRARSPEDIDDLVQTHIDGPIDLAFVDGLHSNAQQYLDVHALMPHMAQEHIILLHDVLNWSLTKSYQALRKDFPHLSSSILMRTPSGMGALYSRNLSTEVQDIIHAFTEEPWFIRRNQKIVAERIKAFVLSTKIKIKQRIFPEQKRSVVIVEPQ